MALAFWKKKKARPSGWTDCGTAQMEVEKIIVCGDNFINDDENFKSVLARDQKGCSKKRSRTCLWPDPAFNAGRYGVACAKVCDYVRKELGVPSVTGMWHENPAVAHVREGQLYHCDPGDRGRYDQVPCPFSLAKFALKLAKERTHRPGPWWKGISRPATGTTNTTKKQRPSA